MESIKNFLKGDYTKVKLSLLWIFVMFNYIYADILTLMDPSVLNELITGSTGGVEISQSFLLIGAILMEIPIAMIIFSLILKYKLNRWLNIIAGAIKTLAVLASLFVAVPTLYYGFFATIEIIFTSLIVWYAWTWKEHQKVTSGI